MKIHYSLLLASCWPCHLSQQSPVHLSNTRVLPAGIRLAVTTLIYQHSCVATEVKAEVKSVNAACFATEPHNQRI